MGAMGPGAGSARGSRARRKRGGFSEINMVPFIDVVLVLLVIFMIAAPMLTAGVKVDLPDTAAKPLPGSDEPLSVSVRKDGKIFIQKTPTELNDLGPKLQAILGEKRETRIFVRGDTAIDYGRVMQVIGIITSAGYTKVALVTSNSSKRER
jgi:biopolymer transport protein TolR